MIALVVIVGSAAAAVATTSLELAKQQQQQQQQQDWNDIESYSFEQFLQDFDKVYESREEYEYRKEQFEHNKQVLVRHHANDDNTKTYQLGINSFMDLNISKELPLGHVKSHASSSLSSSSRLSLDVVPSTMTTTRTSSTLPTHVDWRTVRLHNGTVPVVTPVKNQGGCGSCWAFAATAVMESHIALQTNKLFTLSVQELVSCASNPNQCGGYGGCTGSTAELAYDFVATNGGIGTEWEFGYQSSKGATIACPLPNVTTTTTTKGMASTTTVRTLRGTSSTYSSTLAPVASIVGFSKLPSNKYETLLLAVATLGPVAVSVSASGWGLYKSGIYNDNDLDNRDINHAVVLEGYGTDAETGLDYWLIRNSWGPRWGEDGYIRLLRVAPGKNYTTTTTSIGSNIHTLVPDDQNCKLDLRPTDGVACTKDDAGNDIVPPKVSVCGTSGILFDTSIPVGGYLV